MILPGLVQNAMDRQKAIPPTPVHVLDERLVVRLAFANALWLLRLGTLGSGVIQLEKSLAKGRSSDVYQILSPVTP